VDELPTVIAAPSRGLRLSLGRPRFDLTPGARREARYGLLFIAPWIVGFLLFTALPMIATLVFTFLNLTLAQEQPLQFVGLDNWARLFDDQRVWESLGITLRFAVLWLPFSVIVPFILAVGMNSRYVLGAPIIRTLFFAPYVVPFVAGALIWEQMLGSDGWINQVLRFIGWQQPPDWLYDTAAIYPAFVIIGAWGIGAAIIINLAGLRGIPTELYEAARIDGAGAWSQLRHVTVPLMSPVIFYSVVLGVVDVLQYFLVPLVLKNATGEPGGATRFYNLNLYLTFFEFQEISYGATMAWLLFLVTLVATIVLFALARRYVYYAGER
jgi:multiple sugar transport system permease protein